MTVIAYITTKMNLYVNTYKDHAAKLVRISAQDFVPSIATNNKYIESVEIAKGAYKVLTVLEQYKQRLPATIVGHLRAHSDYLPDHNTVSLILIQKPILEAIEMLQAR